MLNFTRRNSWVWPALGALLLWFIMGLSSGRLNLESRGQPDLMAEKTAELEAMIRSFGLVDTD